MSRNNKTGKFDFALAARKFFVSAFVLFTFAAYAVHERFASSDDISNVLPPAKASDQTQLILASPRATQTSAPASSVVVANTANPTAIPLQAATNTPIPVQPAVASIVATSAPILPSATNISPTETPIPPTEDTTPRVTAIGNANVREGDGTTYNIISTLSAGQTANIIGVSNLNPTWFMIKLADGTQGWISSSVVNVSGNIAGVPQVQPPPQPTALPPTATPSGLYTDGQYTGDPADAFYGTVQVEAIIQNGQITDVQFLDYPHDRRTSQRINSIAMPYLTSEAVQAQSAYVNIISGATLTSEAFAQSLQSALNKAHGG